MSAFLRAWLFGVRVVDHLPYLKELHWRPPLRRWYFPVRAAAVVAPSLRFAAWELLRRSGVRRYRLRESGLGVVVRHPLNDMWVLDEIFIQRVYEPPPEVLERLDALGRPLRVLDLGGHAGMFALFALGRFPGCRVTSLEPNPSNASVLDSARTSGAQDRWTLVRAAAGPADGVARLTGQSFLTTVTAGERDGVEVPVRDAFALLGDADLAKIDIEGGEWPLLEDPRLAGAGSLALVFELHAREQAERDRALELLRSAGYATGPLFDERPDTACVWAWRHR